VSRALFSSTVLAGMTGLLFGVGLVIAGMTNPDKVQNFLDFTGTWDPSLAFVMVGAIGVYASLYPLIRRRAAPIYEPRFTLPTRKDLDPKLVGGSAIFGVGWGLGGICPGPGLVDLGSGLLPAAVFIGAMALGMTLQKAMAREAPRAAPVTLGVLDDVGAR